MSGPDTAIGAGNPATGLGVGTNQTDGDTVEQGEPITVKPANPVSPTYQGTADIGSGTPIVVLPPTVAMVPDGGTVGLATSTGSSAGNGTAFVSEGALTNVRFPAGNTLVSDGTTTVLSKSDNTGLLVAALPLHVVNDTLENAALPHNYAILQDQQSAVTVNNFGEVGGGAATVSVASNTLSLTLANSTSRIIFNLVPCTIKSVVGTASGFSGLLGVAGGALTGLTLPADAAIVQGGVAMTLPVTGTYTTKIAAQVSAQGVLTGFVLS